MHRINDPTEDKGRFVEARAARSATAQLALVVCLMFIVVMCHSATAFSPVPGGRLTDSETAGYHGQKSTRDVDTATCTTQNYAGSPVYYWSAPDAGITAYAMRFSVGGPDTLKSINFFVYNPGDGSFGNDTIFVRIYDYDSAGMPGSVVASKLVLPGTYPQYPAVTSVDFSTPTVIIEHDFHVVISTSGSELTGRFESILSDTSLSVLGRSSWLLNNVWEHALYPGVGEYNFEISVDMCSPNVPQIYENDVIIPPNSLKEAEEEAFRSGESDCLSQYKPTLSTPIKTICINFHIFQKTDGSGNWLNNIQDITDLNQMVTWMNGFFTYVPPSDPCSGVAYNLTDTRIRFSLANIYYYQSDALWAEGNSGPLQSAAFTAHPSAANQLNVYFTKGYYMGASAYAQTPSMNYNWDQFIVMLGGKCVGNCFAVTQTLCHEMGHVLGLYHTYYPSCCPEACNNTSACNYKGDVFCLPTPSNMYTAPCWHEGQWTIDPFLPPNPNPHPIAGPATTGNKATNNMMGATSAAGFFSPLQIAEMHKSLTITSASRYLAPCGALPSACSTPPANLVLWMPFDEISGPFSANAPGGNSGTQYNGPGAISGKVGNALSFDGIDDYVQVPTYQAINFDFNNFTIDGWVKRPASAADVRVIIDKRRLLSGQIRGYTVFLYNGNLSCQLADGAFVNYNSLLNVAADNQWHFFAVSVSRSPATVTFYLDNNTPVTLGHSLLSFLSNTEPLTVGQASASMGGGSYYQGGIDEVEFYHRALSTSEVMSIYNAGQDGKCKRFCYVPWNSGFCLNDAAINVSTQVCNSSGLSKTYNYSFAWTSGTGCTHPGGSMIVPASGSITVPAGQCLPINITIFKPSGILSGQVACYKLTLTDVITTESIVCNGSVIQTNNTCGWISNNFATQSMLIGNPVVVGPIGLQNTGPAFGPIPYRIRIVDHDHNTDSLSVSLNGLPPGEPVFGTLSLAPGASADIPLTAEYTNYDPGRFLELVLETDVDGDSVLEPIASTSLRNIVPETVSPYICGDADANLGVDISDAVYLVAYIFGGGLPPVPVESGDADCSGGTPDISDVVYEIAYIFSGGPAPCAGCKK